MKKRLVQYKVYLDRSRMYSGYIQFFMNGGTFLLVLNSKLRIKYLESNPTLFLVVMFFIFIFLSLCVGRLDYKMKLFHEENRIHSAANPINQTLLQNQEDIKKLLKEIQDKLNPDE